MTAIAFDNSYRRLPERFYAPLVPQRVAAPRLIAFNRALASELGLDVEAVEANAADLFSGNALAAGAEPIALAYAGHQFGQFVPQLGDGRAVLLGEVVGRSGQRRDIQLKGSGPTPFSRRGDGRAALGPVLREYIVSEAMHALGIPTTRALAAITTGEQVARETLLPGGVLTRVAASHIRVGTFQFFAARSDGDGVRLLADHVIARHYPELADAPQPYLALFEAVMERQAYLVARWMGVGFVHGVMNTDNTSISGETIDYGPCAFLDGYDPAAVFSAIDQGGRYAFARQPGIAQWNLARFAETLLPLFDADLEAAIAMANAAINKFGPIFQAFWVAEMTRKLGFARVAEGDAALVTDLLALMQAGSSDFTLTFRALAAAAESPEGVMAARGLILDPAAFNDWVARWSARLASEGVTSAEVAARMRAANPAIIPRNHQVEAVIVAAVEQGDFAPFHTLLAAVQRPYDDIAEFAAFTVPPRSDERVTRTFCGT
jgi:uncharacterized protein YdiU (UPF0061 family)